MSNNEIKFKPVPPGPTYVERNTVSEEYLKSLNRTEKQIEKEKEARRQAMAKIKGKIL